LKGAYLSPFCFNIFYQIGYVKVYKKQQKTFSVKVKSAKKAKKLTQLKLAGLINVDVYPAKRMESGEYNPSLSVVLAIADVLDSDVKALF
jgi:DNA-binding XRE family transcriptional regulator